MAKKAMTLACFTGAFALGISSVVSAADMASATALAYTCAGCHGPQGNSVGPASPTIAQMEKEAFIETMKAFKNDEMYGTIMDRIAKGYTDEEIEAMAGYFAEQTFVPAKQSFDESLVKTGQKLHDKYCEKCHEDGGKPLVASSETKDESKEAAADEAKDEAKEAAADDAEDEGEGEGEEYYLLAGQWTPYMENAMTDFREERREMPKKMKKKLKKMLEKEGDEGLTALYSYYASQQ